MVVAGLVVFSSFALALDGGGRTGSGDGGGGGGGGTEPANIFDISIPSATVPPNGVFQVQLDLTEPRPLSLGSSRLPPPPPTPRTGTGAAINSPSGQACGVVLSTSSGLQISFVSPDGTLGNNTSPYPFITLALQVSGSATVGSQFPVSLDLANSVFLDPTGVQYPTEQKPSTLTIGGTLSVTNVLPGGGTVSAGSTISVLGLGFTPSSVVQINGASVATSNFVSSNQLDVTLNQSIVLNGAAVHVTSGTESVTYYSYLRATNIGQSAQPLLASADPMFSQLTYKNASLPWTFGGTKFTGLALQNPTTTSAAITLEEMSGTNQVLQTVSVSLAGRSKMTRDLADFFGQPASGATSVVIQSNQPIQLLGIQGDSSAGTLTPVVVTAN
jgi:hypothetical protein